MTDKLYGVIDGVYFCGDDHVQELNERISARNVPSSSIRPAQIHTRAVSTKYAVMPILDQRQKATVPLNKYPTFNGKTTFTPGVERNGPWSGFATNVNVESSLRNQFFALQKCEQSAYVPSSNSDMYNVTVSGRNVEQPFPELFTTPQMEPFNPNTCNIGNRIFDNCTRQQVKNTAL